MINKGMMSSNTSEWSTPQDFFEKLNKEFQFDADVAASDENHKCEKYWTKIEDGLATASTKDFIVEWKRRCPCKDCEANECEECVWCADQCSNKHIARHPRKEQGTDSNTQSKGGGR